ncbi:MAG: hypothetical protein KJ062_02755 [Thermoanaerobaculia bacterium]|nr:hypothetical protein [Thermoanaerobaculia bacterium]
MRFGASVDVDFDGTAKQTLRLRIPAPSDARVGSLVFAGTPVDVVWGRGLKLLDLGSIVDGGNGTRLISTYEEDQPDDPTPGTNLLQSTGAVRKLDTQLPRNLIKTTYLEFVSRANGVFLLESGAQLSAMVVDPGPAGIASQFWVIYNLYADQLLYYPLAFNWSGKAILPVVVGSPIELVRRDVSTGWILAQQQFDPYQSGGGSYGGTLTMESDGVAPRLVGARPFVFNRFNAESAPDAQDSCLRLSLELLGCTTAAGQAKVTNAADFSFSKDTRVDLFNPSAGYTRAGPVIDASQPFSLTLAAKQGEEIVAIVSPGDVDPEALTSIVFEFDRVPTNATDRETLMVLTDCGEAERFSCGGGTIPLVTDVDGSSVIGWLNGSLSAGHRYRVTLDTAQLKGSGNEGKAYVGPSEFYFVTRSVLGHSIGSSGSSILGNDPARDLMKIGGLLLVGSSSGKLVAVDVSSPESPVLWARSTGAADQIRGFATDGHGRLFFNALHGASWGVEAVRIEDVRNGRMTGTFAPVPGGVKTAFAIGATSGLLASEYTALAGSLPAGIPTAMDLLVEDEKSDPAELKDFYETHLGNDTFKDLAPDSSGVYTFGIPLDLNANGRRVPVESACSGENAWYHYQRATIANLATGETWSFDVENPWPGGTGDGTLGAGATGVIRARRGDLLEVRYNLRTYGYVAIVGSGITVVDLNRMYRTVLTGGEMQTNKGECGRRLAKYEGAELNLGSGNQGGVNAGIASTTAVVVLGTTGLGTAEEPVRGPPNVDVFSPLLFHGAVHSRSPAAQPGQISAEALNLVALFPGARLRDVAVAPDVPYWVNGEQRHRDLAFYTLGSRGVAVIDVSMRSLNLIGRFCVEGHEAWHVQYDGTRNRLFVGGTDAEGSVIDVFDVSRADGNPRADGTDPRLLSTIRAPWDTNHIAIDESGNGLLYSWDNRGGTSGSVSIPVDDPQFVFVGLYRNEGDEDPETRSAVTRVVGTSDAFLVPLGVPTRSQASDDSNEDKRVKDERKATPLFRVRVALPGGLGETVSARVQTLRALPDLRNLGKESIGAAVALPGGPGWPERDVPITLRKLSKGSASEVDPNGRTSVAFSLYESVETIALLSDPRARKGYQLQVGDGKADEQSQCRRCQRPSFTPDSDVVELLAGGRWARAFLTGTSAGFFDSQGDNYRAPSGAVELVGWADEVPSPAQVSLVEPPQNPAVWEAEAGASVALTAGEALLETTDLSVKGRGVGFAFDRTYRSGMLGYSPMGAAPWFSSLFAHLRFIPLVGEEGDRTLIEYHDGNGHVFPFVTAGNAACPEGLEKADELCVPKGLYVVLESLGDRGYRLLGRSHDARYFNVRGDLVALSDRFRQDEADPTKQGSTLQFIRDGFGQLVAIEDDLGRGYRLTYVESPDSPKYGLLATLTDFDSRRLTYNFDGIRRLESVELPEVEAGLPVVSYGYSSALIAPTAPHHGEDFSPLKLESFTLPGSVTPRVRFDYDGASARVRFVGVAEVVNGWEIGPSGSAVPPTTVTVTAPQGLVSQYTLVNGRTTSLSHLNLEVARGAPPVERSVTTRIEYHPSGDGRIKSVVRGDGGRSTFVYPDEGGERVHRSKHLNVVSIDDQGGEAGNVVTEFPAYNVDNIPESVIDGEGREIRSAVPEPNGRKSSAFVAEGVISESAFDAFGRLKSVKSGIAAEETTLDLVFHKDKRGRPDAGYVETVFQGSLWEKYEYDNRGNVTSWKTSHGTGATAGYDAWDRPVEVTTGLSTGISKPVPATVKRSYYLNGLLEREERSQKQQDGTSRLVTTSYFYNDRQQVRFIERDGLAAETAGGPAVAKGRTEFRYNPGTGLLKDVISPAGIVTHYEYDTAGRLKSEKTGDSLARTRGYDELWRPSYEHDGDEAEWTGSYDKLGRLTAESYPTGASASRTFDKAGRLSTQTISGQGDPSGVLSSIVAHVTSFGAVGLVKEMQSEGAILEVVRSFDTNGRLARQTSSGRLDAELEYETGTGRLLSLTDSTSQTVLRYGDDSSPWPDQVDFYETPSGASCGAPESTTTSYLERDALGAVTLETSNDGTQTTVDYDEEGRPLSVASSAGPTSTFAWDSRGALISATRPEGRGTTRYGYDLDGRIRAKSAIASTGQTFDVSYGYDASGRLWHVQRAGQPIETFEYYPDGVVSKYTRRDGAVVSYEYDAANRMISATPSAAPGGIGSLVVDGGQSYVWDALSRLLSTQRLTGSGIDPRTSVAYGAFDQAGRPRDEIVGTRNALTRTYDVFGRTVNLGLPLGVGAHQALDYLRQYEGCSKRLLTLTSPNGPAALGATWAWAGDGRLLGITTNGPLKTAHRFGYIGGPGAQPGDSGDGSSGKWRLGTLTVGGAGTTDAAMAPPLGDGDSTVWGQFQFGYRHRDNAKLGRLVTSPGTSSILSSQGWAWGIDAASRLTSATAGKGTLTGITAGATANAVERFQYDYGMADQVVRLAREVSTEDVEQVAGTDGRPLSRTVDGEPPGSEFAYDGAGRRVEDDRFTYRWHWFGKLAEVLVKESWPPRTPGGVPVVSPHAGHLIKWEYDALGRTFGRTHLGRLPEGSTDDCTRPFIERREFLWEGGNLLGEAGYAAGPDGACSETIGAIRWRKSYVPGAAGLDDQVQVRVESYGAGSEVASDKLYSYLRDDMNSILSLVEERVGGDAAKPQVPLRFLYTPYGEAHAETGPEVRKTRFDPSLSSLGVQNQVVGDTNHVPGGMTIDFSVPIDLGTLPGGAIVERRITDGTWGALTAEELALGRGTEPERLVLLPLAGWQLGTTYRVRLTAQLKDDAGRSVTAPPTLEFPLPEPVAEGQIGSYSVSYERVFAVEYESAFAAAETAGGAFPGGQNLGWQGHWVDPVTGLDMVRARVYDPRTASWLSEDPLEDVDSPNLYGYVAGRPHEATDPWGLESIFSGLSRKAARDAGRAGARIAGRRAAVLVAEEAAASRVERQIAGRATTSIAKGAAVSGGLRVASGIALGATILGNLAQLVPANDASSPAPSAEDEAAPNDQQIKAESDRLRQALLSQTRNVPSSPVPAAGAGGDGGGDRGCGSGENPREILQTLTDEIVSDFAADPNRVLAMLMPEEIKKGTDPRIARMNFGKAVERRLRDRVAQDPVYGQMFQHVGGANQPDFVGKPGCETFGKMYEVTTATSRSVRDHLGRPYGPGLEFVLYDRP